MIKKIVSKFIKWNRNKEKLKKFKLDYNKFVILDKTNRFKVEWNDCLPKLHDNTLFTNFDSHYIYHPAWAARVLKDISPVEHVDFSSSLHFCTMISAFIPTLFYDYRPAQLNLPNLETKRADLTNLDLLDNSIQSLSCLHTIEHIGLGRYGDALDPNGDIKAIIELQRVAADHILIVVPIGEPKIYFNAHRVYNPKDLCNLFSECTLVDFSFVDDNGAFHFSSKLENVINQSYACGCFYFRKNKN
jgi:hypothetical protein